VNPDLFITFALASVLFLLGRRLREAISGQKQRFAVGTAFLLLCLPGLSFAAYYLHIFGEPRWYLTLRSINHIEVLSACWGLWFGFLRIDWHFRFVAQWRTTPNVLCAAALLCAFIPYAKPVLLPVELNGHLQNTGWTAFVCKRRHQPVARHHWRHCLQSTASSAPSGRLPRGHIRASAARNSSICFAMLAATASMPNIGMQPILPMSAFRQSSAPVPEGTGTLSPCWARPAMPSSSATPSLAAWC
ncbi:MAG TPA: hypothetical protein VHV83_17910, partial [Armatimonadota bacterium]|nr:hypothetical protein [Armatimonadota bacterium]